jgi:transposase
VQNKYGIKEIIFVGDRGMITHANYEKIKDTDGLKTISALTHAEITKLIERDNIQISLFDEKEIIEVIDTENPKIRYCLCKNPVVAKKESNTRQALLDRTQNELDKIVQSKRKTTNEKIGERIGKVLAKTKMGKFVTYKVVDEKLEWNFDQVRIKKEKMLDGCYIIVTDVPEEQMKKQEVVASYKKLILVEQAFRNLKTVQLEIRPIYHKTDKRIRCHAFSCMLAYYVQWHMKQRVNSLFQNDEKGKNRQWTFEEVIERLKSIRRQEIFVADTSCRVISEPEEDQQIILDLLKIKL